MPAAAQQLAPPRGWLRCRVVVGAAPSPVGFYWRNGGRACNCSLTHYAKGMPSINGNIYLKLHVPAAAAAAAAAAAQAERVEAVRQLLLEGKPYAYLLPGGRWVQ